MNSRHKAFESQFSRVSVAPFLRMQQCDYCKFRCVDLTTHTCGALLDFRGVPASQECATDPRDRSRSLLRPEIAARPRRQSPSPVRYVRTVDRSRPRERECRERRPRYQSPSPVRYDRTVDRSRPRERECRERRPRYQSPSPDVRTADRSRPRELKPIVASTVSVPPKDDKPIPPPEEFIVEVKPETVTVQNSPISVTVFPSEVSHEVEIDIGDQDTFCIEESSISMVDSEVQVEPEVRNRRMRTEPVPAAMLTPIKYSTMGKVVPVALQADDVTERVENCDLMRMVGLEEGVEDNSKIKKGTYFVIPYFGRGKIGQPEVWETVPYHSRKASVIPRKCRYSPVPPRK